MSTKLGCKLHVVSALFAVLFPIFGFSQVVEVFDYEPEFFEMEVGIGNRISEPSFGSSIGDIGVLNLFDVPESGLKSQPIHSGEFVMEVLSGDSPAGFFIWVAVYFGIDNKDFTEEYSVEGATLNKTSRLPDLFGSISGDSVSFCRIDAASDANPIIDYYKVELDLRDKNWFLDQLVGGVMFSPYDPNSPNRVAGIALSHNKSAASIRDQAIDGLDPELVDRLGFSGCSSTLRVEIMLLIGDVNLDGLVNLLDIEPFVTLLSNGGFQAEADINQDNVVDLLDVAPFVELLSGG
ncbi:MAG: hypothetical protein AAGA30_11405 [Planctomycetota bacterium]